MTGPDASLRGADPATVRRAVETGEALPGTTGFAGAVDGRLVRDVLGREPLYVERSLLPLAPELAVDEGAAPDARSDPVTAADVADDAWSFDPTDLEAPELVPAGHVLDDAGWRELWTLPPSSPANASEAASREDADAALASLRDAVDRALDALDPATPVAFSGGVDSGLVAAATEGPLYVAGFPDSQDVAAAREAAAALDRELRVVEIDHDDVERAVRAVAAATGRTNAMDVAIAVPLYLVAERVAADGFDSIALGQGADELFGGYAKVAKAPEDDRVAAESVVGARDEVLASLPDQLPRDVLAVRAGGSDGATAADGDATAADGPTDAPGGTLGATAASGSFGAADASRVRTVEPVLPLLHDDVVAAALALPGDLLVAGERRKVALREVAGDRLPSSIAERDKKALQYGSLVSRELDRLARQAGFKRRMDDHVTRYVEDLIAE